MNEHDLQGHRVNFTHGRSSEDSKQRPLTENSPGTRCTSNAALSLESETSNKMKEIQKEKYANSEGDSDCSLPSPMKEQLVSSDRDASGEDSDPHLSPSKTTVWIVNPQEHKVKEDFL